MRPKPTQGRAPVEGSDDLKRAFELGYLAATMRLRRELPSAWRDGVLGALTGEIVDREELAEQAGIDQRYATHVRGVRLIVLRCEAAATMMSWRKDMPAKASIPLRAAIRKLNEEARRLGVA
jgi:hypothetical protein